MESVAVSALKPVSRTTLSEQVAMQLASELKAGRWKPGEKLPSEADLCKVFRVGRSTLREALKSLSFIGLILMRAGGGSYVAEQPSKYLNGLLLGKGVLNTQKDINDLTEARILLETEVAGLCALRASEQDLQTLEKLLKQMKTAIAQGGAGFRQLDLGFHLAIAVGSKNQVLSEMLNHIRKALQELISKSLQLPAGMTMAYKQHQRILEVLRQRDPARARQTMRSHLRAFQRGYKVVFHLPR